MPIDLRLKIRHFFKKHKVKIIIGILIWALVMLINYLLVFNRKTVTPSLSYQMHEPILDTKEKVPEKLKEPIEELLDEYFNYCNNKEYEKAYNMLSSDYKINMEMTDKEFRKYVDEVFDEYKVYTIQNYSNIKNAYIYYLNIYEDVLATGLTGNEEFTYLRETVSIRNEKDGLKLSIGGYIKEENLNKVYENEHIKVTVISKIVKYDTESYKVKVANRTDYVVVLKDVFSQGQLELDIGGTKREYNSIESLTVPAESEITTYLTFGKFVDDRKDI